MGTTLRLITIMMLLLLTACTGSKVTIAPNAAIDPARHHTFAWEVDAIKPSGRREGLYNLDHYLRRQVERELADRGYRRATRQTADFLVEYRFYQIASVDQGGLMSPQSSMNAAWDAPPDPYSTALHNHYVPAQIVRANLELILQATTDQQILWRAVLSKIIEFDPADEAALKQIIETHVPKLFKGLPAQQ